MPAKGLTVLLQSQTGSGGRRPAGAEGEGGGVAEGGALRGRGHAGVERGNGPTGSELLFPIAVDPLPSPCEQGIRLLLGVADTLPPVGGGGGAERRLMPHESFMS